LWSGVKSVVGKIGGKGLLKGVGTAGKKIPIVGSLFSAGFAVKRAVEGDYAGMALEVASGLANLGNLVAPGAGTAASLGIDAAIVARDMGKWGNVPGKPADDFIWRAGQGIQKFSKGDLLMGVDTSTGSGGGVTKLDDQDMKKLAGYMAEGYVNAFNNTEQQTILTKEQLKILTTSSV
jgi:hypothetical protein